MKTIFILFVSSFLFFSCSKDKAKENEEAPIIEQESVQQEPEPQAIPEPISDVLVFTVQIGAFEKANSSYESIQDVSVYVEDGLTKYRLGKFDSYNEARSYRTELLNKYPDAFVQALRNDKPLYIREALTSMN